MLAPSYDSEYGSAYIPVLDTCLKPPICVGVAGGIILGARPDCREEGVGRL